MKKTLLLLLLPVIGYSQYFGSTYIDYSIGLNSKSQFTQEARVGMYFETNLSLTLGIRHERNADIKLKYQQIAPKLGLTIHNFWEYNRTTFGVRFVDTRIDLSDGVEFISSHGAWKAIPYMEYRKHLKFLTKRNKWYSSPIYELVFNANIEAISLGLGVKIKDTKYRIKN